MFKVKPNAKGQRTGSGELSIEFELKWDENGNV